MPIARWQTIRNTSSQPSLRFWKHSLLITRRRVTWLIGSAGALLVLIGVVFTPGFVAAVVKQVEELHPATASRVLTYQLLAMTLGTLMVIGAALASRRTLLRLMVAPVLVVYAILVYTSYLDKQYPNHLLLQRSAYESAWRVLTGASLVLTDYEPRPTLIVNNRHVTKARYPALDMHFHLGSMENIDADELVAAMDAHGIAKIVNLDGGAGELEKYTRDFKDKYPDRFVMFMRPNLRAIDGPNGAEDLAASLATAVRSGVRGLKITKELGLTLRDASKQLVPIDDPRLDALWAKAGQLHLPVLMHVTDPTPFFTPTDRFNERYEELREFPDWSFYGPGFPSKESLLRQREHVLKKHPGTIFIGAHFGDNAENLGYVGHLLDTYPNYYVDFASRLPELGRQPFTTRDFFIKYQDRIVFGTDGGYALNEGDWSFEKFFGTHFEFLETRNEYFIYPLGGISKQGRWRIYGLDLPDEVLRKIYYANASRLLELADTR